MAITTTSDLNVELAELTSAAAPVEISNVDNSLEAAKFRRAIHELESVRSGLDEPMRSDLGNLISSLQAQFNISGVITTNIASALQEARSQATQYAAITAQANQAAMFDAIDAVSAYKLSAAGEARVAARINALAARDRDAFWESMGNEAPVQASLAPEVNGIKAAIKDSPEGEAIFKAHIDAFEKDPKAYEASQKQIELNGERVKSMQAAEQAEEKPRNDRMTFLNYLTVYNAYAHPQTEALLDAYERNAPAQEIESLKKQIVSGHGDAMKPLMPIARLHSKSVVDDFIQSQPTTEQEALKHDDGALSQRLAQKLSTISEQELSLALYQYEKDPSKMNVRQKEIVSAYTLGRGAEAAVLSQFSLQHLSASISLGHAVDPAVQKNIDFITKADNPDALARANAMIDGTVAHAKNPTLSRAVQSGRNQATALAVLTIGFTDQNGGLKAYANHSQVLARAYSKAEPAPSQQEIADADQYIKQCKAYISKTLLGDASLDIDDPSVATRLTAAMDKAGAAINSGEIKVKSNTDGSLAFQDRNSYVERSSAFESANFQMRTHKEAATALYEQARMDIKNLENGNMEVDFERISAALYIDTYRLYNREEGKVLIDEIVSGKYEGKSTDLLQRVEALSQVEAQRMESYSGAIASQLTRDLQKLPPAAQEQRLATLRELNIIGSDEKITISISDLMENAAGAKYQFAADYQKYAKWTPEQLLAGKRTMEDGTVATIKDEGERLERYQARLAYTVASQYYGAQMLDSIGKDYEKLQAEAKTFGENVPESLRLDLKMYETLTADPLTKTHEEKEAAVSRLLDRDTYISDPNRAELKKATMNIMLEHLESDEHREHGEEHGAAAAPAPVSSPEETLPVQVVSEEMLAAYEATRPSISQELLDLSKPNFVPSTPINENEGAGLLDKANMDKFEKAIFEAVKGLDAETRRTMFGASEVLNREDVNKGATGKDAIYSYNEIETALKRIKLDGIEKIADVNNNGFDAEDIRAVLIPGAPLSTQGNGRS